MTPRQKRFAWIASGLAALVLVAGLLLYALNSNIVFFYTPTQVSQGEAPRVAPSASAGWWSPAA